MKRWMVGALLVLLALVVVWFLVPDSNKKSETIKVWAAKDTIPAGEEAVANKNVVQVEVQKKEDWMLTSLDDLKGKRSVRAIPPGRFVDETDFTSDQPIVFRAGEGEYSIKTKPEYVNGGRIGPGDIVQVIYVPKESVTENGIVTEVAKGETNVRDVVVLSVRTQYAQDVDDESKRNDISNVPASVTLKVSEDQAEMLAAEQESGTLSLFVTTKGAGNIEN